MGLGRFHRFQADGGGALRDGGRDAGPVEPARAREDGVPVDHARLDGRQRGTGPVVDHLAAATDRTVLQEIDAQAVAARSGYAACPRHTGAGNSRQARAEVVVGQAGDILGVETEIGQGDGHVDLAAAVDHVETTRLRKTQLIRAATAAS